MVLSRLLKISGAIKVTRLEPAGAYCIDDRIGMFIKYCTDRMSPWTFTLLPEHKKAVQVLYDKCEKLAVALVCRDDGIVFLDWESFRAVVGNTEGPETISVSRRPRQMYRVVGTSGKLTNKVANCDYIERLLI